MQVKHFDDYRVIKAEDLVNIAKYGVVFVDTHAC